MNNKDQIGYQTTQEIVIEKLKLKNITIGSLKNTKL